MVCDVCKEGDAVVQLTQIEGTGVRLLHLCERCAAERGVETSSSTAKPQVTDFLQSVHQAMQATQGDAARCAFCSATFRDFRSTGRLGCAHCYDAFEKSMRDLLRRVHGSSQHVGRRYEPPATAELPDGGTANELRDRLKRAIEAEQFELAADIRDRLRGME
ncbi:MAG TPA: UvrB/UvrC motif-containing protein [Gemmatimonadaceae bacterium]|jgi:protein arginine kinase activator|nr:UvrB/UvrC motif-containing protein [Gemmatimonadaceae bacterium]